MSLDRTSSRTADAGVVSGGVEPKGAHTAARLAWAISALAVAFGVLFLVLLALNSRNPEVVTYEYWGANAITSIVFPAVGALIVSRHPRNALGWLFCLMGLSSGLEGFTGQYATYALVVEPGSLPGAVAAAWLGTWVGTPGFVSIALIPLLFPDGRPLSRRWSPLVWLAAGAIIMATVSIAFMPGALEAYPSVENPFGIEGAKGVFDFLLFAGAPIVAFALIAGIASLVFRYRRSRGIERQQLKWFTYAAALTLLGPVGNTLFPDLAWLIGGVSVSLIPVALGIAVLKYHLYDIDIVINRTLVYAALTACVVGIYVLVVGYLGALFRTDDNLAISLVATALVAVLFQPLRERLQRGVNRLMYGERDEPQAVLARLGQHLERTLTPQAMLPAIAETVAQALKLPYVAIALKQDEAFAVAAAYGIERPAHALTMPLTYQSEMVGQLSVAPRSEGESFSPADQRILSTIAQQIGVVAHAVSLTADLQRSRERLVTAREEERRRLRRDLHDGLGPALASLTLKLDATHNLIPGDPDGAQALIAELKEQTKTAIADIRRVVYDLRPPALDELGLVSAIREQAAQYSNAGLRVVVEAPQDLPPLPAAVEVATYRISMEALTNVVRHAGARNCFIRLVVERDLHLEVLDDGSGLLPDARSGVGLASMRERAAELGGSCEIGNLPGGGTRVSARLPLMRGEL